MLEDRESYAPHPMSRRMRVSLLITFMALIWVVVIAVFAWSLQKMGNINVEVQDLSSLSTILFGATSSGIVMFSVLVTIAGFIQWHRTKDSLRQEIEKNLESRLINIDQELKGRAANTIGFLIGTLNSNPEFLIQSDSNKAYLAEAVQHCQHAYDLLKRIPGGGKYNALNNLVYYSCLYGEDLDSSTLLTHAKKLRKIGEDDSTQTLSCRLTYCRVILQLSSDLRQVEDALSLTDHILSMREATALRKREATFYRASLEEKMNALSGR